ncbi:uncharacterized protein LOC130084836 [Rhinichthys klamathensis goyatoka]|uniref:uncharacterized protein LOC130084836 n=1 Tax=Rhinichthys klamathensis goyatoka TaxID=3034132 RepID=UPI0024B51A92|nr:uncharacterized protein LOC130084836 [Rhinichthys klamathensis goyatoka]
MYCPYCGLELAGYIGCFCGSCGSNIRFLAPFLQNGPETVSAELTEADLIHKYFSEGHTYEVILDFLGTKHNIFLSLSTLKRKLRNAGLTRRTEYTPINTVNAAITHELTGSGQLLGYRALWQTLRQKYFLTVKRDDVMHTIRRLDPSGVQLRHRHRFVRRGYITAGPNQVWHVDGYDKLKPFGVAISGCIDGFSRKVMWLSSGSSNNDPGIIASYYMQCVSDFGLPARLRTDCGTENGTMVAIHCALRAQHTDDFAGALSHMYGTSTANQRIESWWSFFRKQRTQFWIELFSDLRERHLFNGSHEHKCLLRYVFLSILQKDFDEYRELWNNHTIRPVRQSRCHSGKPEAMYHLPHRFDARDCGFPVSQEVIQDFEDILPPPQPSRCGDGNLQVRFADLERQSGLSPPVNWINAVENYITLKNMSGL